MPCEDVIKPCHLHTSVSDDVFPNGMRKQMNVDEYIEEEDD